MNTSSPVLYELPVSNSPRAVSFRLSVLVPVYNERYLVEESLRRVLALKHRLIDSIEMIVVDDCSTDGTWEVLQHLAAEDERVVLLRHDQNRGKGAAIRTALSRATGDITLVHDADLEYNPKDIPSLLVPFAEEGADAVFGSRYVSASYRRALMHRHTMLNKILTFISSWLTDVNLTDLETCYKAVKTTLLKSIPLRSNDFRFEVEIVFKLAKRRARIFEAPIRYLPRTYEEGKKIRARDGLLALLAMIRFWVIDDLYQDDEYGSQILIESERTHRFNGWLGDTLRPYVGERVLEIRAGIGTVTNQFIPRQLYVASDTNPHYLHYLQSYSIGKPYLRVSEIDVCKSEHFRGLEEQFDTALMINVLEHVSDEVGALRNIWSVLEPGGRMVILVPQNPALYGSLDEARCHYRRYTVEDLQRALTQAGFVVERVFDFNRVFVPVWWLNGKVLRCKKIPRLQLKALDSLAPALKRIDHLWPLSALSIIAIGVKR